MVVGLVVAAPPTREPSKCGYESCPPTKPGMLNVHILAHTHLDLGWLKTVDQYYFGLRNGLANVGVQYIFDSVLQELENDPSRRFIYVETGFFDIWWRHQNDAVKARFNKLVQSGQLEFISGGWVMNDEACVHYSNTIDQMTFGIRKLQDMFGACGIPKIGWQIDPFGHSREYASILAQMGMDGYFFGRLDYQDKTLRQTSKRMEFLWQASENLGDDARIFTGILPNTYSPPRGFCFDVYCNDEAIVDDPDSEEYNVNSRVAQFLVYVREQRNFYKTLNIPVTMGNDFNYQSASHWFVNLDKLIRHNNENSSATKVNLLYSTPSCYLKSLYDSKSNWTMKEDDFFPYGSDPHAYWTGYFTSRPAFKYLDRYANNVLQAAKQLGVLAGPKDVVEASLDVLRQSLAVAQHHDAITGTAKQAVANNYVKHLAIGLDSTKKYVNAAFEKLLPNTRDIHAPEFYYCHNLNISDCNITVAYTDVAMLVYNPQGRAAESYLRIPLSSSSAYVVDDQGNKVPSEVFDVPKGVLTIPERESGALNEIVFRVSLPPLGYKTYFLITSGDRASVAKESPQQETSEPTSQCPEGQEEVVLTGKGVSVTINCTSGLLTAIRSGSHTVPVKQSFYWYEGMKGNNTEFQYRASGAYIFRPKNDTPLPVADRAQLTFPQAPGKLVQEVRQNFSSWLTQVIRVYSEEDFVEFDWVVGPIPIGDDIGKEIITRFDTDLSTGGVFYTDSNGREILGRRRDQRPQWKVLLREHVAGNYYPVNSRIYLKEDERKLQFTVLTDRSQGGSSITDGSVELMVHRRLLYDDAFGVGEALNETYFEGKGLVVRGKHRVLLSSFDEAAEKHRSLAQAMYAAPVVTFAPVQQPDYPSRYHTSYSALAKPLPPNVHLLTLEHWNKDLVLLRLEHFYEIKDGAGDLSAPANFSLQAVFKRPILELKEMNLAVTKEKSATHRLHFVAEGGHQSHPMKPIPVSAPEFFVHLTPMQIRTFLVKFSYATHDDQYNLH